MTNEPQPLWKDLIVHSLIGWAMAYLTGTSLTTFAGVILPTEAVGALYIASLSTSWLLCLSHRPAAHRDSTNGDGE